eukprot:4060773-Pleurochrysis_carterae.AAC.1
MSSLGPIDPEKLRDVLVDLALLYGAIYPPARSAIPTYLTIASFAYRRFDGTIRWMRTGCGRGRSCESLCVIVSALIEP